MYALLLDALMLANSMFVFVFSNDYHLVGASRAQFHYRRWGEEIGHMGERIMANITRTQCGCSNRCAGSQKCLQLIQLRWLMKLWKWQQTNKTIGRFCFRSFACFILLLLPDEIQFWNCFVFVFIAIEKMEKMVCLCICFCSNIVCNRIAAHSSHIFSRNKFIWTKRLRQLILSLNKWKKTCLIDELVIDYTYYAICGRQNMNAIKTKYARMDYFFDDGTRRRHDSAEETSFPFVGRARFAMR